MARPRRWLGRRGSRRTPDAPPLAGSPSVAVDPLVGGCAAPAMQLHFKPNGDVLPCCWSIAPLGNIRDDRLVDIWRSVAHLDLVERLDRLDFSLGCHGCASEVAVEGRAGSHLAYFDDWQQRIDEQWPAPGQAFPTPRRFEFELSNACNLQCAQCSGDYSSAIRIHREKRPPLPKVYGDSFFEDVTSFLPHLVEASFAGGEPFMAPENFRIWEAIADVAPQLPVTITTNGTQWNERVEQVLHTLVADLIVSIDGFTPEVYERIRAGSSFAEVMANLERFRAIARERGRSLQINFCMMPGNVHQVPDLLGFAEERELVANVIPVRGPSHASLTALAPGELHQVVAALEARREEVAAELVVNRPMWESVLAQLRAWDQVAAEEPVTVRAATNPQLLMFDRRGQGPADDEAARADLLAESGGGPVWTIVVDENDQMASFPAELAQLLGASLDALVGEHPAALLGLIRRWEPIGEVQDRSDFRFRFDAGPMRGAIVAIRDDDGTCRRAHILLAPLAGEGEAGDG